MEKYISRAKTVMIVVMAMLSIYLVVQLWLVNIPNRSFFPYLEARFVTAAPDGARAMVRPYRMIQTANGTDFGITYSGILDEENWHNGLEILHRFLQTASVQNNFVAQMPADTTIIWPAIIFEYAFGMDPGIFAEALGRGSATVLTDAGVPEFHGIIISPGAVTGMLDIFFVSWDDMWHFTLAGAMPDIAPADTQRLRFFRPEVEAVPASTVDDFNHFYLLQEFGPDFYYHPLLIQNFYRNESGLLHLAFIRNRVEHFFDNPATINLGLTGGIYTFSNMNTIVRYLPLDVLEYTSFRSIGNAAPVSIVSDFSAALQFINMDPNLLTSAGEVFLAGIEARGRENVFWFDIVVNDWPLLLGSPWYTGPGCTDPLHHAIEVTVDHGRVVRYRKIAFDFVVDDSVIISGGHHPGHHVLPMGFLIHQGDSGHMELRPIGR